MTGERDTARRLGGQGIWSVAGPEQVRALLKDPSHDATTLTPSWLRQMPFCLDKPEDGRRV